MNMNEIKLRGAYKVKSFGRDCLGNISGYVVSRGAGWNREIAATFFGDIYERGSFEAARAAAAAISAALNSQHTKGQR